ncbi:MAG TPA: DNA polymerase III subunit beta, partial [Chloroflexi bacterium]|nr:DNA polymerase III subunit beta [Chloroflexota bacterium]
MRLSCLQENLARGLGIVGRAVPSRTTMPILGNVLLATDHGQLKLAATNMELSIVHRVGARVETEGEITVPARNFID